MQFSKMQQRTFHLFISCGSGTFSCDDYNIQTTIEYLFLQPVAFTNQPCNMMPYNAVSNLFAHGYSDSVPFAVIFQHIHHEQPVGIGSAFTVNSPEILIFLQTF